VRLAEDVDLEVPAVAGAQVDAECALGQRDLRLDIRGLHVERSAVRIALRSALSPGVRRLKSAMPVGAGKL